MARGKAHAPEVKAQVVAALLAGQGVCEVAADFNLDEATVRNWKRTIPQERLTEVNAKKGEHIEGLLFEYLGANLRALRAQANVAADETYLREQSADQLAVLHGVMADKGVRLLDAIARAQGGGSSEAGTGPPPVRAG